MVRAETKEDLRFENQIPPICLKHAHDLNPPSNIDFMMLEAQGSSALKGVKPLFVVTCPSVASKTHLPHFFRYLFRCFKRNLGVFVVILFFWLVAEKVKECERNLEFWVFCQNMIGGALGNVS